MAPGRAAFGQAYQMGAGQPGAFLGQVPDKPAKGVLWRRVGRRFGRRTRWVPGNPAHF
jgi:hypothetical protein